MSPSHPHPAPFTSLTSFAYPLFLLLAAILALHNHAHAQPLPDSSAAGNSQSLSGDFAASRALLRDSLPFSARGGNVDEELESLLAKYALVARLLGLSGATAATSSASASPGNPYYKRAGWKRIPIQTRFATFGTKLIPSQSHGDSNGPTLLRYGRSNA